MGETNDPCVEIKEIDAKMREAIEKAFPTPSRAKSLALTKLDEALLWIASAPNIR
jgi:hypothetical protein